MKSKIVSGAVLAAAAVALALGGAVATPAHAKGYAKGHACTMAKGQCGGKAKCMTKRGVCKHRMGHHKGGCHHAKNHCMSK